MKQLLLDALFWLSVAGDVALLALIAHAAWHRSTGRTSLSLHLPEDKQ